MDITKISLNNLILEVIQNRWDFSDHLGGSAFGIHKGKTAEIIRMDSVPSDKKYTSEEGHYKRRGFFKALIDDLKTRGFETVVIKLQSSDTREAVKKLLLQNKLKNPRNYSGVSVDEYPTTFDI